MRPGDLVICVNNRPIEGCGNDNLHLLTVGQVYTIRSLIRNWRYGLGVRLYEIRLPRSLFGFEQGYWAERFRLCRPTSIAAFEKLLKEIPTEFLDDVDPPSRH
ncbi:MAG TPA: hypothetical protein VKV77_10040 [Methylovirgula sp.]|nr:hypothetical protein [Methylovirgula sp.]